MGAPYIYIYDISRLRVKHCVHSALIKHHSVKHRVTSILKFNFPTTHSDSCFSEICNEGNSIAAETKLTSPVAGKKV